MRRRVDAWITVAASVLVVAAQAPALVAGSHTVPFPKEFWDFDNDGRAEEADSFVRFSRAGADWTGERIDRTNEAITTWRGSTDFNPSLSSSVQTAKIWIDGEDPKGTVTACPTWADQWVFGELIGLAGVNCIDSHVHAVPSGDSWYHIVDSDIFLNSDNVAFDWGTAKTSNYSGRGVLAHEVGHSVLLFDSATCGSGTSIITMCEQVGPSQSWEYYSLTNDDIAAANAVYLP